MSYEWMKSGWRAEATGRRFRPVPKFSRPAKRRCCSASLANLEIALETRGYFRPAAKKPKMLDALRAVLTRPGGYKRIRTEGSSRPSSPRSIINSPSTPQGRVSRTARRRRMREAGSGRTAEEGRMDDRPVLVFDIGHWRA